MNHHQLDHEEYQREEKKYPLSLLLHNIEIPNNVGSIFRIADALGVEKIYLTGKSPVPPHRKIRKTSRSTENYVAYEYIENPVETIKKLQEENYEIVSLEITNNSQDLASFQVTKSKVCLILGAEKEGISTTLLNLSDSIIHIPMLGQNSSMNVAAACAIAVYELVEKLIFKKKVMKIE